MGIATRADVLVIGAGPAGSATATHLARKGLNVILMDRARFPREKACAEYCSPGVVDALEDLGALHAVREREHVPLPGMRVMTFAGPLPLEFQRDRPRGNVAMGIRRSLLDELLVEHAERNGVKVLERTRMCAPLIEHGRVSGVQYRNGNKEGNIDAEFVVAADGLHSTFSRSMGLDRSARWPKRMGLVARFSGVEQVEPTGEMHVGDGTYCGLSPVGNGVVNVSLVVPMGSKPRGQPTADFFHECLRRRPELSAQLEKAERTTPIHGLGPMARRVQRIAGPGYLLVGDAAGFFDPLTGEGIHRALRGAEIAASAIECALTDPFRYPHGYSRARSRAFRDKEWVCRVIQGLILSPRAVAYAAPRAADRRYVNTRLARVLGDYAPAGELLRASFIWQLFRP